MKTYRTEDLRVVRVREAWVDSLHRPITGGIKSNQIWSRTTEEQDRAEYDPPREQ